MKDTFCGLLFLLIDFKGKAVPKCRAATCPYHRNVLLEQTAITQKHGANCHSFWKTLQQLTLRRKNKKKYYAESKTTLEEIQILPRGGNDPCPQQHGRSRRCHRTLQREK